MLLVALIAAFAVFSVIVGSGATFVTDDAVSRSFKSVHGNPGLDAMMVVITFLGDVTTLFVFGIIITIIRRTRKIGMVFLIAIAALAVVVMYMKPLIGRPVPPYGFDPAIDLPEDFRLEPDSIGPIATSCIEADVPKPCSYPSGHASRATALAFIVGVAVYKKSKLAGYILWCFPLIIGISRLYVIQHYPSDIIGGFLFGGIVSIVLSNAMKLEQPFFMSRFKGKEDEARHNGVR